MARLIAREVRAEDDKSLQELMRDCPMGERVRITLRRDGGYFIGAGVQAEEPFVYGIFDEFGRAMGVFSAGNRRVWLNGKICSVRYLADLRIHPEIRGMRWLVNGYARVKALLGDGFAQTLILSDNREVDALLTSGRAGIPTYHPAGEYLTMMFGFKKYCPDSRFEVRAARLDDGGAMQTLYDRNAKRYRFAVCLDFGELETSDYFRGMNIADFCLVFQNRQLVAMGAVWDQSTFKQLVVERYSTRMRLLRPLSRLATGVRLPRTGQRMQCRALSAVAFDVDHPAAAAELIRFARSRLPRDATLMAGFDVNDPVVEALKRLRHWFETGRHYLVGSPPPEALDSTKLFVFDLGRV